MDNNLNLKIGDKVINNKMLIGTITNITKKRGDIVVDYGLHKETYTTNGTKRGNTVWSASHIQLLTPEIENDIRRAKLVEKCHSVFEKKKNLTADQAEKILAILTETC